VSWGEREEALILRSNIRVPVYGEGLAGQFLPISGISQFSA